MFHVRSWRVFIRPCSAKQGVHAQQAANISTLFRAIREERVCVIKGYQSASSGAVGDRIRRALSLP